MSGAERWAALPRAPGYEISDRGRVRSYRRSGSTGIRDDLPPKLVNRRKFTRQGPVLDLWILRRPSKRQQFRIVIRAEVAAIFGPDAPGATRPWGMGDRQEHCARCGTRRHAGLVRFQGEDLCGACLTAYDAVLTAELDEGRCYRPGQLATLIDSV